MATPGDPLIRLWDTATGRLQREWLGRKGRNVPISCLSGYAILAFSPDGTTLASVALLEKVVRLWDVRTGRLLQTLPASRNAISCLAFSPDGKVLACGESIPDLSLYCKCAASIFSRLLEAGQFSGKVRLWDLRTGQLLKELKGWNWGPITDVGFLPDGRTLSARSDFFRFWDARSGRLRRQQPTCGDLVLSADCRLRIDIPAQDQESGLAGELLVVEMLSGSVLFRPRSLPGRFTCMAIAPRDEVLALAFPHDHTIRLYDAVGGQELQVLRPGPKARMTRLVFSPDGSILASGAVDATALIWDLRTLRHRRVSGPGSMLGLARAWQDLGSTDVGRAYRALHWLTRDPERTVPYLARHLTPVRPGEGKQVSQLLDALEADDFAARQRASAELARLRWAAEPFLRSVLKRRPSLELHLRIKRLLRLLDSNCREEEELRARRAILVLERIGCEESRRVLLRLASGVEWAPLTQEADVSLRRLVRRWPLPGGKCPRR
jgi:WD40 repeat protein